MRVIGLTGGIACGKTTVAGWLAELGAAVVDADAISHALTAPGGEALPALFSAFDDSIRLVDNTLDRKALAALVFSDESARARLNAILHPLVRKRMEEKMDHCRKKGLSVVVLDVPLLYEAGMEHMADEVWCVSAPQSLQIQRLACRDGLSPEDALRRIRSQWPLSRKEALADAVIHTDRPMAAVRAQTASLYQSAVERSQS